MATADKSVNTSKKHLRQKVRNLLYRAVIYGYAFLYMYTAKSKLDTMADFIKGIRRIPFAGQYAELIGWSIPIAEGLLAIGLIVPWQRLQRISLVTSTIMMGIFTIYIGLMMAFVEKMLCRCGGVIESLSWPEHLFFNLLWLGAGVWAIKQNKN